MITAAAEAAAITVNPLRKSSLISTLTGAEGPLLSNIRCC